MYPLLTAIYDAFHEAMYRSFDFKGKASRSEYFAFVIPVGLLLMLSFAFPFYYGVSRLMSLNIGFFIFFALFSQTNLLLTLTSSLFVMLIIVFTVPMLSALSRRLNDCGLSGFYMITLLVIFLPLSLFKVILVGVVITILTILTLLPSIDY